MMRPIDADAFEYELRTKLLPELIKKYGEEEALNGLHFSFNDCICNLQSQPTIQLDPCSVCKAGNSEKDRGDEENPWFI